MGGLSLPERVQEAVMAAKEAGCEGEEIKETVCGALNWFARGFENPTVEHVRRVVFDDVLGEGEYDGVQLEALLAIGEAVRQSFISDISSATKE